MKIYKIWREDDNIELDSYDSAIVIADNEDYARKIHPNGYAIFKFGKWYDDINNVQIHSDYTWCSIENIRVEFIGVADKTYTEACVVLSSFNAG